MARDDAAFTEFVAARSAALLRTAYLLTGDRRLAEDVLQTALLNAYPLWGGFRGPRAAEAHVRSAMVRTLTGWRRRHAWRREKEAVTPPEPWLQPAGDDVETRQRLWPIVLSLPPRQRSAIVLRSYEGLTESQAAAILRCSAREVRNHHAQALHTATDTAGVRREADEAAAMSKALEDRLRTDLLEEARRVDLRPGFLTAAAANVRIRRRRRQLVAVAIVAAVAALGAGAVALDTQTDAGANPPKVDEPNLIPSPPAAPFPPVLALADLQQPTSHQVAWDTLPWHDTALPRVMPRDVESAPSLSQDPVETALALVAGPGATVGLIGDDARLRQLDGVDLERPGDPDGSGTNPVASASLTSDGRLAAFAQANGVVILDIASGSSKWFDVPSADPPDGVQTSPVTLRWHPDQRHVLIGGMLLDTADGSVEPVPYQARHTAFAPDGAALEITGTMAPWPGELVRWVEDEPKRLPISIICCNKTPPSATDDSLVIAGSTNNVDPDWAAETGWIVIDIDTGQPLAMLRAPPSWHRAWLVGLHGWLGNDAVLIQTDDGIVAWTPSTGAIERVIEVTTDVSLALAAID